MYVPRKSSKTLRALCAVLALALSVCLLPGCGNKAGDNPGAAGTAAPADESAQEYVYVSTFLPVEEFSLRGSLSQAVWINGSFYASSYEVVEDHTPEGVVPSYEGEYWEYAPALYRIGMDGKAEKTAYQPERFPQVENERSSLSISQICGTPAGGLALLEHYYHSWYDGPEDLTMEDDSYWNYYKQESSYTLRMLDLEGNEASAFGLEELVERATQDSAGSPYRSDDFYPRSMAMDKDGRIYLASNQTIYILDDTGAFLGSVEAENWIEDLLVLPEGGVYCVYYGNGMSVAPVDPETRTLGKGQTIRSYGDSLTAGGGEYDLYYSNGTSFYGYDLETGEETRLLNWLDCDMNMENDTTAAILEDGRIVLATTEWDEDYESPNHQLIVLEPKPYDSVPHKEALTLATLSLTSDLRAMILDFNRKNGAYRIEVKDYSEYNNYYSDNEADYTAGLTKLRTEIAAGNLPDILTLDNLPMEQFAAKGLLEDLYPYLDADSELHREDLFSNVLEALEVDGKLYTTCGDFGIYTVVGAPSVVGDTPGWTYDEFNAALASMPEGCTAFDVYTTRDDMLHFVLALDGDSFVDWNTGECSFDSEAFYKLLEFVKSFPGEFDWSNYEYSDDDSAPSRIAAGKQMLLQSSVSDFQEQQMYRAMFGGEITYIGFPTEHGVGNMISIAGSNYAMSAKCAHKDVAWAFLRNIFLNAGSSSRRYGGIPIQKDAFEKRLEKAMEAEYQKDAQGNYVLDENGERIEVSHSGWAWGNLSIEIFAMKPEEAEQLRELIASTTKLYKVDDSIYDIVSEQLPAFFDGQKTAQEVAKLIQSKAMLYVNEQR